MNGHVIFKTNGNRERQIALLSVSLLMFVIFLIFLILEFSGTVLVLFILSSAIFFIANFYYKKFYDIEIGEDIVNVRNVWKTKKYPVDSLKKIEQLIFFFPYPFNPFIEFTFNRNEKIATRLPNYKKIHFSKGGMHFYLKNLRGQILSG